MATCKRCGTVVIDGANFCQKCGFPIDNKNNQRKQGYAASTMKCPACGMEIQSFTAFCPACGHEIKSANVAASIKNFSYQMNNCDIVISNTPAQKNQNNLLHSLFPLVGIDDMSSLSSAEKNKASIINNYVFPNDRESILEALLYIKSQMVSLAANKVNRNTYTWLKIWKNKAAQLYERAEILFKGDAIAKNTYSDILQIEKKAKKTLLIRTIIPAVGFLIFLLIISFLPH